MNSIKFIANNFLAFLTPLELELVGWLISLTVYGIVSCVIWKII